MINFLKYRVLIIPILLGAYSFILKGDADENSIKAAYICYFGKYIEWPQNDIKGSDFVIGVNQKGEIYNELKEAASTKNIQGKAIRIKQVDFNSTERCHMLVLAKNTSTSTIKKYIHNSNYDGALIITDQKGGLELGATINFIEVNNRICFEYNLRGANDKDLKTSSQLLKIARKVIN